MPENVLVSLLDGRTLCVPSSSFGTWSLFSVERLKEIIQEKEGIPVDFQRLTLSTKNVSGEKFINFKSIQSNISSSSFVLFHLNLRLQGGKGGFGALLRGQGSKGKKTTNHDDCRDLSGRRIRQVRMEKNLAEWYQEQKEKKETKRTIPEDTERAEASVVVSSFDSTRFHQELKEISEEVSASVEEGLRKASMCKEKSKQQHETISKKVSDESPKKSNTCQKRNGFQWDAQLAEDLGLSESEEEEKEKDGGVVKMEEKTEKRKQTKKTKSQSINNSKRNKRS